ncbi:MAG: thiamine-phosphate kinase [Actinomycetota bacterium]|nr:thiamine-phosphate kinase [Actinomycetota bacterium]
MAGYAGTLPEAILTGELSMIEGLRTRLVDHTGQSWVGDDAAVVPAVDGWMLLAADAVVAGVHADLSFVGLDDLGWKAMVANVSDVAAMGGTPRYALVTVTGPLAELDSDLLYDGLLAAGNAYGCSIVGGDLSSAPSLAVTVAVVGHCEEGGPPPVRRSGARPGDTLFVTGPLGSSAAGLAVLRAGRSGEAPDLALAHRRPRPRLAEGTAARMAGATAMIDVSDGLAADVRHLAAESGVGVVLEEVPFVEGASETLALGGGEDYELIVAAPDPARVETAFAGAGLGMPLVIGRCTADPAERRLRGGPLPNVGWEHR